MRPFGCPVTILNTHDSLGKFEGKVGEEFLVGYSVNSKAFIVFNNQTRIVQETLHVNFLENKPNVAGTGLTWLFDIDSLTRTINYQPVIAGNQSNPMQNKEGDATFDGKEHDAEKPKSTVNLSPSSSALSGEQDDMTKKKDKGKSYVDYFTGNRDFNAAFEDYSDDSSNDVNAAGPIVPTAGPTHGKSLLQDASQSPDMLESKDIVYSDHENVGAEADFNNLETSITVSPIPTTRIHNAHPISQIIGFGDPDHPKKVYKVVKALYGLHQAPRAWYETLATYLLENGFHRGQIDQTLFIKKKKLMKDKFQMSSIGELTFFLDLQVKQKEDGIFIKQDKYVTEILKKFGLTEGKSASTPIVIEKPLLKDPDGEDVDVHNYRSMIGSLMYLTSSRPDIMFAFWNTVAVKQSNDVTRLQALVDKNKVVVTEAAFKDALHLDDVEGVDCLPNEEIFTTLARMGHRSRVKTPLFEGMLVAREPEEQGNVEEQGDAEEQGNDDNAAEEPITAVDDRVDTSDDTVMKDVSNQGRMINELYKDKGVVLMNEKEETEEVKDITGDAHVEGRQADIYQINMDHAAKVLSMQEDKSEVQEVVEEVVEVVTTAKLITEVIAAVSETVSAAVVVPAATVTPAPVKVDVPSTRRTRGVVIRDPEEESSAKTPTKTKSKDKGKGIMIEEPKPLKKKQQVKLDEAYARKLHEELNQDIEWEVAMNHVKQKAKENLYVQRYQTMKKRPQTEAQARRNMMMYLKNTVGFKMDYFKGMYYDDIRPIFEAKFNSNIEFLLKSKEQMEEKKNRAIASINKTPA
nr:putative ribonuclease H-like domain-containing protein [Tanacetum cinerariifolium]